MNQITNLYEISLPTSGYAAIASGIIGIVAYVFLIGFLVIRNQPSQDGMLSIRIHSGKPHNNKGSIDGCL